MDENEGRKGPPRLQRRTAWKYEHPAFTQDPADFARSADPEGRRLNRLGDVAEATLDAVALASGIRLDRARITVLERNAHHIVTKERPGRRGLTPEQFAQVAAWIATADACRLGRAKEGHPSVIFEKKLAEGGVSVIALVILPSTSVPLAELRVSTAYILGPDSEATVQESDVRAPP